MSSVAGTAHKDPVFNVQGLKTKARGRDISGRSWVTFRGGQRAKTGGERGQPSLRAMRQGGGIRGWESRTQVFHMLQTDICGQDRA